MFAKYVLFGADEHVPSALPVHFQDTIPVAEDELIPLKYVVLG